MNESLIERLRHVDRDADDMHDSLLNEAADALAAATVRLKEVELLRKLLAEASGYIDQGSLSREIDAALAQGK